MEKIKMGKIVEMDGDEMTKIIWQMIKDATCARARFCGPIRACDNGSMSSKSN